MASQKRKAPPQKPKIANNTLPNIKLDDIDNMSKDDLAQIVTFMFSGPLPPPATFAGYEETLPGTADRILKMAENQASHRQYLEKKMIDTESRDSLLGIVSALIIALVILISGTAIIIFVEGLPATIAGLVIDITGIATVIGTFLKGTSNSWKNNKDKG